MTKLARYTLDAHGRVQKIQPRPKRPAPVAPFFLLGLIMPMDVVGSVPPLLMDVARYGLTAVILLILYTRRRDIRSSPALGLAAFLLIASGLLAVFKAIAMGGELLSAATAMLSALAAFLLVRERINQRALLLGFVTGCALSSADIIMQSAGLPSLGNPSADDFRFSGFSFSSTHVAPLLAVAICLVITRWVWSRPRLLLRGVLLAVLASGLFLSQGRVGVAGLLAAVVVLLFTMFRRHPGVVAGVVLISIPVLYFSGLLSALLDFIMRTDAPQPGELTSGRAAYNSAAWSGFLDGGALGVDPAIRHLYAPHMAPLTSAIDIGPFGLLATSILCVALAWVVLFAGQAPRVFRMISAVALATAFIEPLGFFVGFTGAVILMLCFANSRGERLDGSFQREGEIGQLGIGERGQVRRVVQ